MAKKTSKKRGKRTAAKSASTRAGGGGLASISTAELRVEIARRNRSIEKLQRKRTSLAAQIADIDRTLAEYGATAGGGGGKRPRNSETLSDALARVLKNTTMSVTDAALAVQQAGYQTTAANFRTIVNQTLIKDDRFENVSRGQYRAK